MKVLTKSRTGMKLVTKRQGVLGRRIREMIRQYDTHLNFRESARILVVCRLLERTLFRQADLDLWRKSVEWVGGRSIFLGSEVAIVSSSADRGF